MSADKDNSGLSFHLAFHLNTFVKTGVKFSNGSNLVVKVESVELCIVTYCEVCLVQIHSSIILNYTSIHLHNLRLYTLHLLMETTIQIARTIEN